MNAYPAEHTKAMLDYWMDGIVPGAEVVAAARPGGAKVLENVVRTAKAKAVVERPPRRDPVADLRPAKAARPPGAGDNASSAKPTRSLPVETTRLDVLLASSARRRLEETAREYNISIGEVVARLAVGEITAAARTVTTYDRILDSVQRSAAPVGAAALAQRLNAPLAAVQRLLALASSRGEVVRLARGLYSGKGPGSVTAAPAERVFPNLSAAARRAAHQRYRPQTVITASGRSVTVAPDAIQASLARRTEGRR